jgi:SAM-dependent methyltransferase
VAICRENVGVTANVTDALEYVESHAGCFDVIVCNHVIEHFSRSGAMELCNSIYKALVPGGRAIITVPNGMTPWCGYQLYHDLTHDHLYTPESLMQVLDMSGFQGISLHAEGPVPYDALTGVRYALWKMREMCLRAAFAIDVGVGRAVRTHVILTQGIIGVGERQS